MKHRKLLSLLLALLLLAGCSDPAPAAPSVPATQPEPPAEAETLPEAAEAAAAELGLSLIGDTLELDAAQLKSVVMTDIQFYEDEAVVRYTQTYEGVEIYGSSMVAIAGEDPYCAGTYYDFSEVFDEGFASLAEEAATVPDWMTDDAYITFHTDTLRPVIYTTADHEACLARCFEATLSHDGSSAKAELITSPDGSVLLEIVPLEQPLGFTATQVTSDIDGAAAVSLKDGKYYAYNEEYNVFVADQILENSDDTDRFRNRYTETASGWRLVGRTDPDLIYSSASKDWSSGTSADALQILTTYCDVAQWYRDRFAYDSLDGKGGRAVLAVKETGNSLAMVDTASIIFVKPQVADIPEILVHEFAHAMFAHVTDSPAPQNETKALTEALSDTFGALYMAEHGDPSWHLAPSTEYSKDIPGNAPTMEDYAFDRYMYDPDPNAGPFDFRLRDELTYYFIENVTGGRISIELPGMHTSSSSKEHENAFIVSHVLYDIWNNVFQQDNEAFGRVLFRSLRYMPSQPNFAQFRDAFIHSLKKDLTEEYAAGASGCFANAGIHTAGSANFQRMTELDLDDYYDLSYPGEIPFLDLAAQEFYVLEEQVPWDHCYITDGNMEKTAWNLTGEWKESSYSFNFENENGRVDGTRPYMSFVTDFQQGGLYLHITDDVTTGMTYEEVSAYLPLTPLEVTQLDFAAMYNPEAGCDVLLFFLERGSDQILYRAEVYRTE